MESMFSSNRPGWAALLDEKVTAYLPDLKYIHDEPLARRLAESSSMRALMAS